MVADRGRRTRRSRRSHLTAGGWKATAHRGRRLGNNIYMPLNINLLHARKHNSQVRSLCHLLPSSHVRYLRLLPRDIFGNVSPRSLCGEPCRGVYSWTFHGFNVSSHLVPGLPHILFPLIPPSITSFPVPLIACRRPHKASRSVTTL